ncbi:hypothetical protein MG293_006843 [Ovis ammon polii]|uniref:Uncharacterized protein n=1 Tax=Ovis ammon polii TaxID=230172 RepID=A0AAD4U9Y7_OVIAM|nr:hypothetical protein MG293_006843 [Ovis ammon polii]
MSLFAESPHGAFSNRTGCSLWTLWTGARLTWFTDFFGEEEERQTKEGLDERMMGYPHSDLDPHGGEHAQLFFSGCGFWPEQIYASFAIAFCRDVHLHIDDLCLRSSEMPNNANLETYTLTYRKAYTRDPEQAHFADDVMKNYSGSLGLARDRLNGYSD